MNLSRYTLPISGLLLIFGLTACHDNDTTSPETNLMQELKDDADKFNYALGMMIGERVLKQYSDIDYNALLAGMKAQHQKTDTLMDITEAGETMAAYQQKASEVQGADAISKGEAYLKANAELEGVTVTESGLQYSVMTEAEGDKPVATDTVTVHYRGTLLDGTEFDSSYSRNQPASFGLNQVIAGWTEGVQLMNVGSQYKFVIPYLLAYGERGAGANIGPFETLIFEIELISIN